MSRPILKPSTVLRRVKAKTLPHNVKGGYHQCEKCHKPTGGETESPEFHENGMYVHCPHCKATLLYRPIFPACEGYPEGFEIDLTGERKKYPLELDESMDGDLNITIKMENQGIKRLI